MPVKRTNAATLIVGDTGSGKSSLLSTVADWVWNKYGKITLLYSTDGGGWGESVDTLIQSGIIWAWKLRTRREAFETCAKASKGYWPRELTDPSTGESSPGCELISPSSTTFTLFCPQGHEVIKRPNKKYFQRKHPCPGCGNQIGLDIGTIKEETVTTPGFDKIGAVCYDSLTSMSDWIMMELARMTANSELRGEDSALGGRIMQGGEAFGANNRSHYGFTQIRCEEWILDSAAIPGLVAPPIWTARELKAADTNTRLPIYGPKIAGMAKTSEVPAWVGNCLGTTIVPGEDGKAEWRLYLEEYRGADGIPHLCKTRAAPGILPKYLTDPPEKYFSIFNLGYFFDLLDDALDKSLKEAKSKYQNAPGMPSGRLVGSDPEEPGGEGGLKKGAAPRASVPTNRPRPQPRPRVGVKKQ